MLQMRLCPCGVGFRVKHTSKQRLCYYCQKERQEKCIDDLINKRGVIYNKWRKALRKSLVKRSINE